MRRVVLAGFSAVTFLCLTSIAASVQDDKGRAIQLQHAVDAYITPLVKDRKFSGVVLVGKDGKALVQTAYGFADWTKQTPLAVDSRFMIFSVSKQFTAALILRLHDQKKLSVDDPVGKYLAPWPKEWDGVTLGHLLAHSAGIEIDTLYFWLVKHYPQFWPVKDDKPPVYEPKKLLNEPGKQFRYSNAGYTVLTVIACQVTGKSYGQLIESEVFGPLQMKQTGLEEAGRNRVRGHQRTEQGMHILEQKTIDIMGAGDVTSTVQDLLKWDEALYRDQFLSPQSKERMFRPYVKAKKGSFGYGWLLLERPGEKPFPVFSGSGSGFTAYVIRKPESHLYIAVLSNLDTDGEFVHGLKVLDLVEQSLKQR